MAIKYGFHEGLDFAAYQAIPGLNYSTLKHMAKSPMSFRYHADNPTKPTDEMHLGTAAHRAILEPDRAGDFVVWPGAARRGKEWDKFCYENQDKQILTKTQCDYLVGISVGVRRCKAASKFIRHGQGEVSAFWRDKAAKRDFKGRLDWITTWDKKPCIVDLKTTRDCRPFKFGNDAYRLGYHIQFAMYHDGYYYLTGEMPRVVVMAIENKPPFETAFFMVPDDVLMKGHDDYARMVKQLTECEQSNEWPPALETETDLTLPSYAYGDDADDLSDLELVAI